LRRPQHVRQRDLVLATAWQTFRFWIPLYLATERHIDLKQIALFVWLQFLTADFGGVFGGFVAPCSTQTFGITLVWSRI
jgi:ACS family hexuronate transporter-like MFS transporter